MRSTLETAFRERNDTNIDQVRKAVHDATADYAQAVRGAQKIIPEREMEGNLLDQGEGVLTRSGTMNANLTSLGVDCSKARVLAGTGHDQIAATLAQVHAGDVPGARVSLAQLNAAIRSSGTIIAGFSSGKTCPRPLRGVCFPLRSRSI